MKDCKALFRYLTFALMFSIVELYRLRGPRRRFCTSGEAGVPVMAARPPPPEPGKKRQTAAEKRGKQKIWQNM